MTAYLAQELSFAYPGGAPVVSVPQWELPAGGVTALCGGNGSGKTTLLHLLALLQAPTAGELRFFGERVTDRNRGALRRQVSLMLQDPYLFRGTVRSNVEWGLRVRGCAAGERRRRALEALERVGLGALVERPATELSGGERQRVALARVLVLEPRVVCLDEPTNHLDTAGRRQLEGVLRDWVAGESVTLVLASHDPGFARRLGARVWRVEGGRLAPAEPDNMLPGRLDSEVPSLFLAGDQALAVHSLPPGTEWVRVGPRQIVLAREVQPSSARNQLSGRIERVEPWPDDELLVTVTCGSVTLNAVITRASWGELGLKPDGPAVAVFKASAIEAG